MFLRRTSLVPIGVIDAPENKKLVFASDESVEPVSFDYDPDNFVYFRCRAITANESNGNGDYFPEDEIRKAYKSFVGVGLFKDHQSDSVDKSIGKVIWAEWVPNGKYVECYCAVDKILAPDLAHRVKMGIATSVSMGCAVQEAECSICHNKAHNVNELCTHMAPGFGQKGRKNHDGSIVYEINRGIQFNELSLVTVPADPTARIFEIYASLNRVAADVMTELKKLYVALNSPGLFPEEVISEDPVYKGTSTGGTSFKALPTTHKIVSTDMRDKVEEVGKNILSKLSDAQKKEFFNWITDKQLPYGLLGPDSSPQAYQGVGEVGEIQKASPYKHLWFVPYYDAKQTEALKYFMDIEDQAVWERADGTMSKAKEALTKYFNQVNDLNNMLAQYAKDPNAENKPEIKEARINLQMTENDLMNTYPRIWGKVAQAYDKYRFFRGVQKGNYNNPGNKENLNNIVNSLSEESKQEAGLKATDNLVKTNAEAFADAVGAPIEQAKEKLKEFYNLINKNNPEYQLEPGPWSMKDTQRVRERAVGGPKWVQNRMEEAEAVRDYSEKADVIKEKVEKLNLSDEPYYETAPDPEKQKAKQYNKSKKLEEATKTLEELGQPLPKPSMSEQISKRLEDAVAKGTINTLVDELAASKKIEDLIYIGKNSPEAKSKITEKMKSMDASMAERLSKELGLSSTASNNKVVIRMHNSMEDEMSLSIGYNKGSSLTTSFFEAKQGSLAYRVAATDVLPIPVQEAINLNDPRVATPEQIVSDLATRFSTLEGFKLWAKKRKKKNKKALLRLMPKEDLAKKMIEPKSDPIEAVDVKSGTDTVNGRNNEMLKENTIPKSAAQDAETPETPVTETPIEETIIAETEKAPETLTEIQKAFSSLAKFVESKLGATAVQTVKMESKIDGVAKAQTAPEPKGAIKEVTKTENPKGHIATSALKAEAMDDNWTVNQKELEKEPKMEIGDRPLPPTVSMDEKEISSEEVSVKNSNQHAGKVKKYFGRLGPGAEGTPELAMDLKSSETNEAKLLREAQAKISALEEKERLQNVADKIYHIVATLRGKNLIAAGKENAIIDTLTQRFADAAALEGLSAVVEGLSANPETATTEENGAEPKVVPQVFDTVEQGIQDPAQWLSENWNK